MLLLPVVIVPPVLIVHTPVTWKGTEPQPSGREAPDKSRVPGPTLRVPVTVRELFPLTSLPLVIVRFVTVVPAARLHVPPLEIVALSVAVGGPPPGLQLPAALQLPLATLKE